jgi:hypothetical protein
MNPPRPRRRFGPWPILWIFAAVGHALGNAPHPQITPGQQLVLVVTPVMPQVVPSDRPDWDWGPETAHMVNGRSFTIGSRANKPSR